MTDYANWILDHRTDPPRIVPTKDFEVVYTLERDPGLVHGLCYAVEVIAISKYGQWVIAGAGGPVNRYELIGDSGGIGHPGSPDIYLITEEEASRYLAEIDPEVGREFFPVPPEG